MVVNVDVSNAVFWNETTLMNAAKELTGLSSYNELAQKSQPVRQSANGALQESQAMLQMRKLKKNEIFVRHPGRSQKEGKFHHILLIGSLLLTFVILNNNSGETLEDQGNCSGHSPHQEIPNQG